MAGDHPCTPLRVSIVSKPVFTSAADAETAFYDALARSDLAAMMAVWSEDDEVVCIHPGGPRVVGLDAVRELWRQILASGVRLNVRTTGKVVVSSTLVQTVHSVLEEIAEAGSEPIGPPIVATNVYTRGADGWRMVMHHASPTPDLMDLHPHGNPRVVH